MDDFNDNNNFVRVAGNTERLKWYRSNDQGQQGWTLPSRQRSEQLAEALSGMARGDRRKNRKNQKRKHCERKHKWTNNTNVKTRQRVTITSLRERDTVVGEVKHYSSRSRRLLSSISVSRVRFASIVARVILAPCSQAVVRSAVVMFGITLSECPAELPNS